MTENDIFAEILARDARKLIGNVAFRKFVGRIERLRDKERINILKAKIDASHARYEVLREIVGDTVIESGWTGFIADVEKWAADPAGSAAPPEDGISDSVEE